jgi:hypothetical protein
MYNAYWINSITNKTFPVSTKHIELIFDKPEIFGLTREYIVNKYNLTQEKFRYEGKARSELIKELFDMGWIRIRYDIRKHKWNINYSLDTFFMRKFIRKWCEENNILQSKPDLKFINVNEIELLIEYSKIERFLYDDTYFINREYLEKKCMNCKFYVVQRFYDIFCENENKNKELGKDFNVREMRFRPSPEFVCEHHKLKTDSCNFCNSKKQ